MKRLLQIRNIGDALRTVELQRFAAALIVVGSIMAAAWIPGISPAIHRTSTTVNYSATLCPSSLGGTTSVSLPTKGLLIRSVKPKSLTSYRSRTSYLPSTTFPTYIQGNPGTAIAFNSTGTGSQAALLCDGGGESQWFVGGSAGLTSSDLLDVVNSGLGSSNVVIYPYTPKGPLPAVALSVGANSESQVSVGALAPGENSVALNVVTQTGRVTSFLLDHRKRGLSDLGSSFVASTAAPTNKIYIGGLINSINHSSPAGTTQVVRLLVPGGIDANISTTVYTNDNSFAPIGLAQTTISHQKVLDITLPTPSTSLPYGIVITSDQPLLASVLTTLGSGSSDFAWANSLSQLSNDSRSPVLLNLAGEKPTICFMGSSISAKITWSTTTGARGSVVVSGADLQSWSAPSALSAISIQPLNKSPLYASAILASGSSMSYLPLASHEIQSGSTLPTLDIRTLAHAALHSAH